ncbi:hypothetical protein TUM19329_26130 [Legionella antarctica]|uniref:Uncharacterized protein n=1 Tax=Legionella antarctica TaxID=2708020 RepID=A0A6F8T889_9GAMM|nr:hypothetical protein [Legionella antarctica]BCA96252.1 hypothetical protein TUM19329_26130 [Legionella antarctica]
MIEASDAKQQIHTAVKAIIDAEYPSPDALKKHVTEYYKYNKVAINHQRNEIHAFFNSNHKTSTRMMFDEMFKALDSSETDTSAPAP